MRFRVRSPEDEEVHIHGYDIAKDVKAGQTAKISLQGDDRRHLRDRVRGLGTQIAELRVDP